MDITDSDEMLMYLHRQIDPHDQMNPRYADLRAQIDAIVKARADCLAVQLPPVIVASSDLPAVLRPHQLSGDV